MKKEGILYVNGELDVLPYYVAVSKILSGFLKGKEIATKIYLPKGAFLKRGSNSPKLFVGDIAMVGNKFLLMRKGKHLDDVKERLNEKEENIWRYFVPRKMIHYFYATNGENLNGDIDRIFIDIDRKDKTPEDARKAAVALVQEIKEDNEFNNLVKFKIVVLWTGSSFHIILLLDKKVGKNFYEKYLSYGKKEKKDYTKKWAESISRKIKMDIKAGHEREKGAIIIDSSNTPSGKLARVPFSLHVKNYQEYDGVCVPISIKELKNKDILKKLKKLTPDKVLNNLNKYKKLL
jgi:hypothetical protein